jgi:hypothetical protein
LIGTNVADIRTFARAPMNQFANVPAFPDATFTDVTRPNVDTLYSLMWFDVSQEPLLISVPDSGGRFYLLQMCDMWTDVFDSPGKRTTGTIAQVLAIAGPDWQGQLPAEATPIHCPTGIGWIIGRTQTNGKADYEAVRKFQAGLKCHPAQPMGEAVPAATRKNQFRWSETSSTAAWVLSLDGEWQSCRLQNGGRFLSIEQIDLVKSGMSGSPIIDNNGAAIGLISASGGVPEHGGQNIDPSLTDCLCPWLLRKLDFV